jgi:hypothetical protein
MSVETLNSMDRSANLSAMIVGLVVVFCCLGISLSHYSNKLHPTALQKSQQFKDMSREKQKIIDLAGTNHSL